MPTFTQSLQGRDLGHLRIIAEQWGVAFDAPDARVGLPRLAVLLLQPALVAETIRDLPMAARLALDDLLQNDGRLPWPLFVRRYGAVREVGPGRRDRERPWGKSASPAEALWYRGLVGRAFFDASAGPEEFAYVPEDLLPLIPARLEGRPEPLGRPATPAERAHPLPASDRILDDATTLLAALRCGLPPAGGEFTPFPVSLSPATLEILLSSAGLLDANAVPMPEPTRAFLEARRGEALALLVQAWQRSATFDELRLLPGLQAEGEWQNDPLRARRAILDFLSGVELEKWWSLPAFVAAVHQRHPDFQRAAGDYDSWFLRRQPDGEFLRGFEHWEDVDGALVRFMICGPLHWLGVLDLAAPGPDSPPTAFRYSAWGAALLRATAPDGLPLEEAVIQVGSDARLRAPRLVPRAARYQVARFCEPLEPQVDAYRYHITPDALGRARQQGLTVAHLLALLRRYADSLPPTLVRALERWEQRGAEASIEAITVLRVASPEMLQTIRSSRAARFLGEPLGPTAVIVKAGAGAKVLAILAELGYLGAARINE